MFPSKGAKVIVALHFSAFTEANVVEVFVPPDVFLAPSVVLQSKGEMWMMGTFVLICKHTGWNMKHPQNDANWTRFGDTFIGLLNNSTPKPLCSHRVYWWQWADWLSTVSRYWTCKHAARESQWISIIHIVCWTHNIWQPHQHMFFFNRACLEGVNGNIFTHWLYMSYSLLPHTYSHVVSDISRMFLNSMFRICPHLNARDTSAKMEGFGRWGVWHDTVAIGLQLYNWNWNPMVPRFYISEVMLQC